MLQTLRHFFKDPKSRQPRHPPSSKQCTMPASAPSWVRVASGSCKKTSVRQSRRIGRELGAFARPRSCSSARIRLSVGKGIIMNEPGLTRNSHRCVVCRNYAPFHSHPQIPRLQLIRRHRSPHGDCRDLWSTRYGALRPSSQYVESPFSQNLA